MTKFNFLKSFCTVILIGSIGLAFTASASPPHVQVVVNGTTYDVSEITTSFAADKAQLEGAQFTGNSLLGFYIAQAVGDQLGDPNSFSGRPTGPMFI